MGMPADKASQIPAPQSGNVYADATSTSSARYEIPDAWKGEWVEFHCLSQDMEVLFGDSTVSVTAGQNSGVASEVLTANAATGLFLSAAENKGFLVPDNLNVTHFAVIAAGTGRWVAYKTNL